MKWQSVAQNNAVNLPILSRSCDVRDRKVSRFGKGLARYRACPRRRVLRGELSFWGAARRGLPAARIGPSSSRRDTSLVRWPRLLAPQRCGRARTGCTVGRSRFPPVNAGIRHCAVKNPTFSWGKLPHSDDVPRYLPGGRDGWCLCGLRGECGLCVFGGCRDVGKASDEELDGIHVNRPTSASWSVTCSDRYVALVATIRLLRTSSGHAALQLPHTPAAVMHRRRDRRRSYTARRRMFLGRGRNQPRSSGPSVRPGQ
jgi:hypothetical protein